MIRKFQLLCIGTLLMNTASPQPFAKWTSTELTLDNGIVRRVIQVCTAEGHFITTSYKPAAGGFEYLTDASADFQFDWNRKTYSGLNQWRLKHIQPISDSLEGNGAAVTLLSADKHLELTLTYLLYPRLPVIRKSLTIKNLGTSRAALESVDVEKFGTTDYYPNTFSWICADYGRRRSIGPYKGNSQDALLIVHNMDWRSGIVLGNEATGVVKRTAVFWNDAAITVGLTHRNDRFPFRKWLRPGGSFTTPQVFTMVYNDHKDPDEILNTSVPDFIRRHMGIRLSRLKEKPTFVYNTWQPFKREINEKLIMELAKTAAGAGMKEFIIDDGWEDNLGDWDVDKAKFPNGLKPVFSYIRSLGMKPGLWISLGSASADSKVFRQHPEWFVRDSKGHFTSLHITGDGDKIRSACFSTGWKDYFKHIVQGLINDNGLEYLKMDFSVVTSAYIFDNKRSGCYADNHPGHKDHNESLYVNYQRMWELLDELHAVKPDLFIDCTFEAIGGIQLIDYALLQHAEGDWLSNFEGGASQNTDLRIRNMAWWRSPAVPAAALIIGNPEMQDTGWEQHIKSLAGALPIMLGDPRQLSPADKNKYREYADWLRLMEKRYGFMAYRQDLPGFGEPMEGSWDGFQRINSETRKGGIIGVFRQGSHKSTRTVTVNGLDLEQLYTIREMDGKKIVTATGTALQKTGFPLTLPEPYSGVLFEIGY